MPLPARYTYLRDTLIPGQTLFTKEEAIRAAKRLSEIENCTTYVLEVKEFYICTKPSRATVKRGYLKDGSNIQKDNGQK